VIDRVSQRERPPSLPLAHQRWSQLLFLHWRAGSEHLRPLVPSPLELDTFEQETWVGLVAFRVTRMRPALLPPIPWLSSAYQVNVRTYVHHDGVPGVWFFSVDASNALAVWAARLVYGLPFRLARMRVTATGNGVSFESRRVGTHGAVPTLKADWQLGNLLPSAPVDSLAFFLLERYVLYAAPNARLYRARIHHCPWPLRRAKLTRLESTMLTAQGLREEDGSVPLLHAQARPMNVSVWPRERVLDVRRAAW